jgi:hypothetical protein
MIEKILIANRGDQPLTSGAAAKPYLMQCIALAGDFAAGGTHV